MTKFQRAILALLVVALCIGAWMGRYQLVSSERAILVLDRWTGIVQVPRINPQ